MRSGRYSSLEACAKDVRIVWTNAYLYNPVRLAHRLKPDRELPSGGQIKLLCVRVTRITVPQKVVRVFLGPSKRSDFEP